MKAWLALSFCAAILATGCASLSPSQQVVVDNQADREVSCSNPDECAAKWARAIEWVRLNSDFPIETQTGTLVVTRQPPVYDAHPGISIALEPQGYGYTRIEFAAGCGLIMPVCNPRVSELRARFVASVMDGVAQ